MVDNHYIDRHHPYKNKYANMWLAGIKLLVGTVDLRPRSGTFTTPWMAPSSALYKIPKLEFVSETLSDLLDQRAIEINSEANRSNKRIAIMWSGGIDSTMILTSFLKNLSDNDKAKLTIILTTTSILENIDFYLKYIRDKIECLNYLKINIDDNFLNQYILLHGDPADCLFGPSIPMYLHFVQREQHLMPWKENLEKMKEHLNLFAIKNNFNVSNFGDWYVDKISNNLMETGQDKHVTTIANWWWWAYFNFRWEFSCQRPFFYLRAKSYEKSISEKNITDFAKNTFLNTDKFQLWSYSNLKKLINHDLSSHKQLAKDYVFEFDKNEIYFKNKIKIGTYTPSLIIRINNNRPVYYDKNWAGYNYEQPDSYRLKNILNLLLEGYKG